MRRNWTISGVRLLFVICITLVPIPTPLLEIPSLELPIELQRSSAAEAQVIQGRSRDYQQPCGLQSRSRDYEQLWYSRDSLSKYMYTLLLSIYLSIYIYIYIYI